MTPWQIKAHREIAALCKESYERANRLPNGTFRKRHVPYSVPSRAQDLIACLDRNDEAGAKRIFLYDRRGVTE